MFKIILFVIEAILSIVLPIFYDVRFAKKTNTSYRAIWNGVCVYVLFLVVLNSVINTALFSIANINIESTVLDAIIKGVIYALCGILGRFIWLRFVIKETKQSVGVAFGMGIAAIRLFFTHGVYSLSSAILLYIDRLGGQNSISQVFESNLQTALDTNGFTGFLDILQMVIFFVLEISVSVLLFGVVKNKKSVWYGVLAAVSIFVIYGAAMLSGYPIIWRVAVMAVFAVLAGGMANNLYKKLCENSK